MGRGMDSKEVEAHWEASLLLVVSCFRSSPFFSARYIYIVSVALCGFAEYSS